MTITRRPLFVLGALAIVAATGIAALAHNGSAPRATSPASTAPVVAAAPTVTARLTAGLIRPIRAYSFSMVVTPSPSRKFQLPFPNAITPFTTERIAIQSNQPAPGRILARAAANCSL